MKAIETVGLLTAGLLATVAIAAPAQAQLRSHAQDPVPATQPLLALTPAVFEQATSGPKETFDRLCAACHGVEGKGDGPAAMAFDPSPPDFTDAELWEDRTDEELASSIADGVRMMPPFGAQLQPEQITALVKYIRELSCTARTSAR
jgi:mono/diheme cytochrome c family protein